MARGLRKARKTEEAVLTARELKEAGELAELGEIREPVPAKKNLEERGETGEPRPAIALSLSWSDYWQALTLAAACFRRCFFFFNCLFFFKDPFHYYSYCFP